MKSKMDIEIQVALNFVISYLYNKMPRRRVNIFGEELERALKNKFKGHWYPETPVKGSAFRCLKTGDPIDPVFERAAKESGVLIQDILENLPSELAVWVDPGEVSYRIGEKNTIKVLYSGTSDLHDESPADREVTITFNPEAQCFRPIEVVGTSLSGLSLSPKMTSPFTLSLSSCTSTGSSKTQTNGPASGSSSAPSPILVSSSFKGSQSPAPPFISRVTAPLIFTTATFAQTKFGSTKLKTSSKRANRMSPTEFSNYIKQRAMQQQIHHIHHHPQSQQICHLVSQTSSTSRCLSPNIVGNQQPQKKHTDPSAYFFPTPYHPHLSQRNVIESSSHTSYLPDLYESKLSSSFLDRNSIANQLYGGINGQKSQALDSGPKGSVPLQRMTDQSGKDVIVDGLKTFGLNSATSYPAGQYQHLLVAN